MNDLKLSRFAITLWFIGGTLAIELLLSLVMVAGPGGLSTEMLVRTVAVAALCGFIVDALRFISAHIKLETYRNLKCKRIGKDMRQLLERNLGSAQGA